MTTKEALEKIRAMFNSANAEKPTGTTESGKPTDYTLKDGTTLTVDGTLAAGAKCVITDAGGTPAPAADGDYTLEDGTLVTVASGTIATVTLPDGSTTAATGGSTNPDGNGNADDSQTEMKKLKEDFVKISASFEKLKSELETFKASDKSFKEKVEEGFKLVAKLPAAEPTEKPKNTFRGEQRNYEQQRLKNISLALSQLR